MLPDTSKSIIHSSVIVEAPASIANIGPGFDILAMAIEGFKDKVQVTVKPGFGNISIRVDGMSVPEGKDNVAYGVVREAIERFNLKNIDFHIRIVKGVPVSSGLGSSGATAAATAYAISLLTGLDLDISDVIRLAGAGEAIAAGTPHYDNVSASILGGIVIVDPVGLKAYKVKVKTKFWIAVVTPNIPRPRGYRKTQVARSILPREIDLYTHVKQSVNIAKIVYALHVGDLETLGEALSSDYIVEPYRAKLIPGYWELKRIALSSGALGFNIAGAGPSVFSIYKSRIEAQRAGKRMLEYLKSINVDASLYITKVTNRGVRVVG